MVETQDNTLKKVTLIEDINKAKLFLHDVPLTVNEFDDLYDMDCYDLYFILKGLDGQIALARHYIVNA